MPKFVSNFVQVHIATFNEDIQEYKFLILKRSATMKVYPNLWQVITGTIEENETALQTALRELDEETGLIPKKIYTLPYLTTFFNAKKDTINASPVFGVVVDYANEIKLSDEHSEYLWLSFNDILQKLELPSHIEATKIFYNFVLINKENNKFEITDFDDLKH